MKVSIFTTMPQGIYSGGRYLSLILAHSLSRAGAEINYVTNNLPLFQSDFVGYDSIAAVQKIVSEDFTLPDDLNSDWVVVIPTGGFNSKFYNAAIGHARTQKARIALLSFETPNWFGAHSPFPRSPMPTESWRQVIASGGLVVSIAQEGIAPAKAYFGAGNAEFPRRFSYWHPALNDLVAADIPTSPEPRKKIVMFTRTEDPHKGAQDLLRLPRDLFEGHVLSLVFGRGINEDYVAALRRHFAPTRDFAIEYRAQISDHEKFKLLSEACLLLFPSYFEGYGYPPVEAAWMGVPTVAYDLPLLREVAGEAIWTAPSGDTDRFADMVRKSLSERNPGPAISALMKVQTDTLTAGRNFLTMLECAGPHLNPVGTLPKNVSFAGSLPGLNAAAAALAARRADGLELSMPEATLSRGRVTVTGSLLGLKGDGYVRIGLPNGGHIIMDLVAQGGRPIPFIAEGVLPTWPAQLDKADLSFQLVYKDGRAVDLGAVLLLPDLFALLCDRADGGIPFPNDTLVIACPHSFGQHPGMSIALRELMASISSRSGRVTLLCPQPDTPIVSLDDLDFLPRFAAFVPAEPAVLKATVTDALTQGRLVVVTTPAAKGFFSAEELADLCAETGAGKLTLSIENGDLLALISSRLEAEARHILVPNAQRWGRNAEQHGSRLKIALLPSTPLRMRTHDLTSALRKIRFHYGPVSFVIPETLVKNSAVLGKDGPLPITPITCLALQRMLSAEDVVGLLMDDDATPHPMANLFNLYHRPLLMLADGADRIVEQCLERVRAKRIMPMGSLADMITDLVPTAPSEVWPPDFPKMASSISEGPIFVSSIEDDLPELKVNDVFCFNNTQNGKPAAGLLLGWNGVTDKGVELRRPEGFWAFRLPTKMPGTLRLEVMLHVTPKIDPALSIELLLNDQSLGRIPKLRPGSGAYGLDVPMRARGDGQQTLRLRLHWESSHAPEIKVFLMAVSLQESAVSQTDFNTHLPTVTRLAPRFMPQPTAAPNYQVTNFGLGQVQGFLRLASGWSEPEDGYVWSDGQQAILGFVPALMSDAPIMLTLQGRGIDLGPKHNTPQRMILRNGSTQIIETLLPVGSASIDMALGTSLLSNGCAYLLAEFPDAISPAEARVGEDTRRLSLALSASSAQKMPYQIAQVRLSARKTTPSFSVSVRLRVCAGVLRLSGIGSLPPITRFLVAGLRHVLAPHSLRDGGWEVLVPLRDTMINTGSLMIMCLSSSMSEDAGHITYPDTIQSWSDETDAAAHEIEIFMVGRPCSQAEIESLLVGGVADDLIALARPPLDLPVQYAFHGAGAEPKHLPSGWANPEANGTWSVSSQALVQFPQPVGPAILTIEGIGFLVGPVRRQRVCVHADNFPLATAIMMKPDSAAFRIVLPPAMTPLTKLRFTFPDAISPEKLELSADPRALALYLQSISLQDWPEMKLAQAEKAGMLLGVPALQNTHEIVARTTLSGDLLCVAMTGKGAKPMGIAHKMLHEHLVVIHPRNDADGWGVELAISLDQVNGDGVCVLYLIWPEDGLENSSAWDVVQLNVQKAIELAD